VAGSSGVERLLTKPGAAAAAQGLTRRIGTAAGTEFITEGPQGGQERLAANLAQQRAGYDVPAMQGVIGAGVQEGLTGALTAGPVGALRGPQTTTTKTQQQTEIEQARAEEEARLQKEREKRATPQYQQEVVDQYEALAQQKQDLIKQKKKIQKGSLTEDADNAFNKDIEKQLRDLQKQIAPLASEYYPAKAFVTQQAKQAALDKMSPEEYMLQQMGMETKPLPKPKTKTIIDEYGQIKEVPDVPEKEEPSAAQKYMQEQFETAQGFGQLSTSDYADFMMRDPAMAAQIVQNRLKVPGLTASENNLILSGISLRLKDAAKQELSQRQADLQAQTLTTPKDQMALFNQSTEDVEKLRAEGKTNFDYLDPMFERSLTTKEPVVRVPDVITPSDRAPKIRAQIEDLLQQADQADNEYRAANRANEPTAAQNAFERSNTAIKKLDALQTEGGVYAREFVSARQAQNSAMAQLDDITEQLRTGVSLGREMEPVRNPQTGEVTMQRVKYGKGVASSNTQSLINKANQVRAQLIAA
jgi:hypothetical protein